MEFICIERILAGDKIISYKLLDKHNKEVVMDSSDLKNLIQSDKIRVNNLTLTSNNRIIYNNNGIRPIDKARSLSVNMSNSDIKAKFYLRSDMISQVSYHMKDKNIQFRSNIDITKLSSKLKLMGHSLGHIIDELYYYIDSNTNTMIIISPYTIAIKDGRALFAYTSPISIDLSNVDASEMTDASSMFRGCVRLSNVNLNNVDTSQVTSMANMFYRCTSLVKLDLSGFDTAKVTDMHKFFSKCNLLRYINLSSFNTSNVTDMSDMFSYCSKLEELDLSNFITSKVASMSSMFEGCGELKTLNISSFTSERLEYIHRTFYNNYKLEEVDMSNLAISNLDTQSWFIGCYKIKSIKLPHRIITTRDQLDSNN